LDFYFGGGKVSIGDISNGQSLAWRPAPVGGKNIRKCILDERWYRTIEDTKSISTLWEFCKGDRVFKL